MPILRSGIFEVSQLGGMLVNKIFRFTTVLSVTVSCYLFGASPAFAQNLCHVGSLVTDNVLNKPATVIAATEQSCRIKYLGNGTETWGRAVATRE